MAASDIRAVRAYIELLVKDNALASGLDKAAKRLKSFGSTISGAGVKLFAGGEAIAGPLEAAAGVYAEMGANAARSAEKTGLSVEATTTLGYAAKVSGGQMEDLEEGIDKMSKTLEDAQEGSATAQQSLRALGLTIGDLKNLSQEDRFKLMADRISKIQDPAQKAAAATNIFGERSVKNLMPLLDRGADGIDKLQQHARDLGLQMSGEDAKGALEFSDKIDDLWAVMKMGAFTVGSTVMPPLMKFVTAVTQIAVKISSWIGEHKKLVTTIFLVATGVAAAGAVLVGLGTAISFVGVALGGLAAAIGIVGAVIGAVVSPIGLIVIGIGAAAAAFLYFSGVGRTAGNAVMDAFHKVWDALSFVFNNTGSLSEAWAATIAEGSFLVQEGWAELKGFFTELWESIQGATTQMWDSIVDVIANSMNSAAEYVLTTWVKVIDFFDKVNRKVTEAVYGHAQQQKQNELAHIDAQEKGGAISHQMAEQMRAIAIAKAKAAGGATEDQAADNTEDQAASQALDAIKADYDQRKAALAAMQQEQHAADAQDTADEKAKTAQRIKDEVAVVEAKKKAYEAALKAKHDASGEKSLADQAKDIFGQIMPAAAPPLPMPDGNKLAGGMDDAMAKTTAASTFSASAAAGMFGGGPANQHLSTIAQQTTRMNEVLAQIARAVRNGGVVRFG